MSEREKGGGGGRAVGERIAPCPLHLGVAPVLKEYQRNWSPWRVRCAVNNIGCWAGPLSATADEAIAAWNAQMPLPLTLLATHVLVEKDSHERVAAVIRAVYGWEHAGEDVPVEASWMAVSRALAALTPEDLARFGIVEGK